MRRSLVPPLPPRVIPRPRLIELLDQAAEASLTLVAAGPGIGKTVLLSDWIGRHPDPTAWLALTASDNDPARFWRLFLNAARNHVPSVWTDGMTTDLLDAVYSQQPAAPRTVVVLDDAQVLTDPQILEGLDWLVRNWSHQVRLVIATRSDPLLPLHRYRLAGQIQEIRAADLAMTASEAQELLAAHGVTLPARELRLLLERTEGWTAALRLAALRMQDADRPELFVAELAMDEGSVGEYLTEEVLARQPESIRRLLVETSFLDEVNGPLADAVTGMQGCGTLLARLCRTNSFVIPLDSARTSFRYHQLFREVLSYLAQRQSAELVRRLHRRAATWFRDQDDVLSALRWALRGEDAAHARSLLVRGGLATAFVRQQDLSVLGLQDLVGEHSRHPSPAGAAEQDAVRAAVAAVTSDRGSARAELVRIERLGVGAQDDADAELQVTTTVAELMLARLAGDFGGIDRAADRLLTQERFRACVAAVQGLRAAVMFAAARNRFSSGRPDDVEPLMRAALAEAEADDIATLQLEILSAIAIAAASAGRPRHADAAIARAVAMTERDPDLSAPLTLQLAVARNSYVKADFPEMAAAMDRALAAGPIYVDLGIAASVAFLHATLLLNTGRRAAGRAILRDSPTLNDPAAGLLRVYRDGELANAEIESGRPGLALQILAAHDGSPYAVSVAVPAARAHLALDDLTRAEAAVRAVLTTPSPLVNRVVMVEALVCRAEIALRGADDARALEMLDRAIEISAGDIVIPFFAARGTFDPLLERHPALGVRWPLGASRSTAPAAGPQIRLGARLADPLTDRERDVLRLMATSMSAAAIAAELDVSVNTVKTHFAAIYHKLSVRRRREAVFRARELQLL